MKKLIILLLLMACYAIPSGFAQTEYVNFGGNLDLIVKSQPKSYWFRTEKKTYGIRKDGEVVLPPEYSADEVAFPADVYLLVFMNLSEKTVYVYSTENGEEIFRYVSSDDEDGCQTFCGFVFRRVGNRRYELSECFNSDGEQNYKTVTFFYRYRGVTSQQQP